MKAGILVASTALASLFGGAGAQARGCHQLFTVKMGKRAGRAVYGGHRRVTRHDLRVLGYIERCQIHTRNQRKVRAFDHAQRAAWEYRRWLATAPTPYQVVASYYDDAGSTACGFHAGLGVANLTLPCGTRVTFRYGGAKVTAEVDDRGPYVGGRQYDLNVATKDALGCPDMCGGQYTRTALYASRTG